MYVGGAQKQGQLGVSGEAAGRLVAEVTRQSAQGLQLLQLQAGQRCWRWPVAFHVAVKTKTASGSHEKSMCGQ